MRGKERIGGWWGLGSARQRCWEEPHFPRPSVTSPWAESSIYVILTTATQAKCPLYCCMHHNSDSFISNSLSFEQSYGRFI